MHTGAIVGGDEWKIFSKNRQAVKDIRGLVSVSRVGGGGQGDAVPRVFRQAYRGYYRGVGAAGAPNIRLDKGTHTHHLHYETSWVNALYRTRPTISEGPLWVLNTQNLILPDWF